MVSSTAFYYVFLAAVAGERLVELWLSRRNAMRSVAEGAVEVGRAHYRVMTAFHSLFLAACVAEVAFFQRPFPGALGYVALALAVAAQGLRYWAIATLGARWNTRILVIPNSLPIVNWPYRYVRHPNYVAVVVEMLAVPLVHGAYLTAALFSLGNAALLRVRIRAEERALGAGYSAAFAATPRFLPGARRA